MFLLLFAFSGLFIFPSVPESYAEPQCPSTYNAGQGLNMPLSYQYFTGTNSDFQKLTCHYEIPANADKNYVEKVLFDIWWGLTANPNYGCSDDEILEKGGGITEYNHPEKRIWGIAGNINTPDTNLDSFFLETLVGLVFDDAISCDSVSSVQDSGSQQIPPKPPKPEWHEIFEKYCSLEPETATCFNWQKGSPPNISEEKFREIHQQYCIDHPDFDKCPKVFHEFWKNTYADLCKERGDAVSMCQGWTDDQEPIPSEDDFKDEFEKYCKGNFNHEICHYYSGEYWKISLIELCDANPTLDVCYDWNERNEEVDQEYYNEEFEKFCKDHLESKLCPQIGIDPWKRILQEQCQYRQEGTVCDAVEYFEEFTLEEFIEYCRENPHDRICNEAYLEDWKLQLDEFCQENGRDPMCTGWRPGETPNIEQGQFEREFEQYCKGNLESSCTRMVDADWSHRLDQHCQENSDTSFCQNLFGKQNPTEEEFIDRCLQDPDEKFCKKVFRSDWKIRYAQYCSEHRDPSGGPEDICWQWYPGTVPTVGKIQFDKEFAIFCDHDVDDPMCKRYIEMPEWIKQNVKFYVAGDISHEEFVSAIQFLIKEKVINVPQSVQDKPSSDTKQNVKDMIKQNAEWWANGLTTDRDFVKHLEFLIQQGILNID